MLKPFSRRYRPGLCSLVLLALLAGCEDMPTAPRALHQAAGGREWVAVTVPVGLPRPDAWLPYLHSQGGDAAIPADVGMILGALSATDLWSERVEAQVDLARYPEMDRTLYAVRVSRDLAADALTAGDTLSAVRHLSGAAERIRGQAPAAVALRVLTRVEAALETRLEEGPEDPANERALRLIHGAREALAHGDPARALQRALYALQLAEGKGIPIADVPEEWEE